MCTMPFCMHIEQHCFLKETYGSSSGTAGATQPHLHLRHCLKPGKKKPVEHTQGCWHSSRLQEAVLLIQHFITIQLHGVDPVAPFYFWLLIRTHHTLTLHNGTLNSCSWFTVIQPRCLSLTCFKLTILSARMVESGRCFGGSLPLINRDGRTSMPHLQHMLLPSTMLWQHVHAPSLQDAEVSSRWRCDKRNCYPITWHNSLWHVIKKNGFLELSEVRTMMVRS